MTTQSARSASPVCFTRFQRQLIVVLCGMALGLLFPRGSSAQQVAYYDFNTPQAASPSQSSSSCFANSAAPGVLFCFNSVGAGLSYIQDSSYTTTIDPNATSGSAYALLLTQSAQSQSSSVWYSIPQDVAAGFTVWYAFRITNASSPTGDGFAFVIQNAQGNGTDLLTNCVETGSGLTALGGAGGCLGYGGIDNSIALEGDTFPDSFDPWDFGVYDYDDNHIAMQDCGPGLANSPAHYNNNLEPPTPDFVPTTCLVSLGGAYAIASNPSSSAGSGEDYIADSNPHQVVMVYNGPNDSPANYLSVYLDPAFNAGTHTPVAGSTPIFSGPFDITQRINLSNGNAAYVGFTAATGGSTEQHELMGFSFTPHGYGNANVCPTGQTTPAPCSATLTETFNFTTNTTIGSIQVVTQGATGLDFQLGSGSTCTGTISAGNSCTVNVTFAPIAPGLRMGAVELFDNSAIPNLLATKLVYGIGQGAAAAFSPLTTFVESTGPYPLSGPTGVAVDAAGDIFVADAGTGQVVEIGAHGTFQTVGTGLLYPQGLAVDGAGDLFIADNDLNAVVEVPAGCTSGGCQQIVGSGLSSQLGVAVDGPGDVFISDFNGHDVVEVPANGGPQTVVYSPAAAPPTYSEPVGLAVDAAGDLFIADYGLREVAEVPAGCASSSCQTTVGSGWSAVEGVAVDAAGDVYVADAGLNAVIEVPAGCASASCQITVASTSQLSLGGGFKPYDVAVDGQGDVFIADYGNDRVDAILQQFNALNFAQSTLDNISGDSPQSILFQNIGNQSLNAFNPGLVFTDPDFYQVPGSGTFADCTSAFSLVPGATCNLSIDFDPLSPGPLSGSAAFTDNALNSNPATQIVPFNGAGLGSGVNYTLAVSTAGSGSGSVTGTNCFSGVFPSGTTGNCTATPAAGSQFTGWSGGTCSGTGMCLWSLTADTTIVANFSTSSAYTLTLTEVGTGSGTVTDDQSQISCTEANGSVTGTCAGIYASGTSVTLTSQAAAGATFLGWGGACASSGSSPTCIVSVNAAENVTASFSPQNFGSINVCPSGQAIPSPCSSTQTVTFNLAATTTIGAIQVVTQGATGLDFTLGSGSTCVGTVEAGSSCTVNVNFAPLAPGLRAGAVELFDSGANLLTTAPIYGIGQGPEIAFGPGTQTTVGSGLNQPQGVAVDAAGDVFISNYGLGQVLEVTPGGVQTTVPASGLANPYGVAVDGAGDVFIADPNNNRVVEVTPSGVQTAVGSVGYPYGVAVDAAGDVFIVDSQFTHVVKVTSGGVQTTVPATGLTNPYDVAVDGAGDVFISDPTNVQVIEVTPGGVQTTVPATGLVCPYGLAVDAAGDVYIADPCISQVVEVSPSGVQTTVPFSGLSNPISVAVDGKGDVFTGNTGVQGVVTEAQRSQLPSLSFALTNVGSTSVDSPQLISVQNVGNQPLTGSLGFSLGGNFTQNASPDCSGEFPLAPGSSCNDSFSFTPQTTGYLAGTATFSDNTLNLSPLVVLQTINLSGNGGLNGQPVGVTVPNVVGLAQTAAATTITGAGLAAGTVSTASSSIVPSGSVIASNPEAGTQVSVGSAVRLLVSNGQAPPPMPNPLSLENNYFVTGDFASAGVTLRGLGVGGIATGTITIPDSTTNTNAIQGVPDGADIIDAFLYWETLESTPSASATSGTFNNYPITGQQIASDLPSYTDGALTGTLRAYRADVNAYFPVGANGVRTASGGFTVSLPDGGATALPLTEGASLVVIYRVLSPNFPLKSVVIYDGSANPNSSTTQNVLGFYDSTGAGENTNLYAAAGSWNNSSSSVSLGAHASQFSAPLNAGNAYAAVILSTPVSNSDNDGILDAWKTGPAAGDFYAGQAGYYDAKTGSWVSLPGALHGEKDLFVQLDYMCGAVLSDGSCDPAQENLFPAPDTQGNDPLAMVKSAFAADGVVLHLEIGNAVPETTCADSPGQLCQFPSEPGVIGWKNSLEFSKLWPRNLTSCAAGGDCSIRFPYGQKDSYHYVLFGHSLAIPAWNTRYGTLTAISVVNGVTTISTANRGASTSINYCPSRITISGVLGNPSLNGVYNTTSCPDAETMIAATPGVPNWSYPNSTLAEPVIGLTSGKVTSISGYSDLGGADSAVTLGLWETAPNQNMSKRANVIAGTLFHEIGHTLGLTHGGLYYDSSPSYVPNFDVNCKPNYQSVMNYLFQLDGVGPSAAVAYSNQQLVGESPSNQLAILSDASLGAVTNLTDGSGNPATYSTTAWYTPTAPSPTASAATLHCDGTPLTGDTGYRVNGTVAPIAPSWANAQNVTFDGVPYTTLRGYNDVANLDLRQVGATGGEFASLSTTLSFGSSATPLQIAAGGNVVLGSGGTVTLGSGKSVTLASGGNVTLGSGGTITLGSSGGNVTLGSGGNLTLGSGAIVTPGSNGLVTLGSGGNVTLGSGGTITLGSGGTVTLGSGGNVTLGSGGTIALGSGGSVTIPSTGGSYSLPTGGGTITLGSGGNVTLGSGGNVTLGSGGTIALGSGGNVTLGSGGNVTLGSGGTIALGSGGTIALGSGGNVTLGSGGTIALGSGGNVTLGSGGNVTLGSGGTVTLGSGGDVSVGSGGNVTLGAGGTVTLGSGGNVTLGSGGNVTLGSGGTIAMGSGGTIALGSGGNVTLGSGGDTITLAGNGGTVTLGSGGNVTLGSGGTIALGSGGTVTVLPGGSYNINSSGGTITLGSGGNVTLGSGGNVTLGSGGNVTLGSGGTIALGSGGNVTLGSGGASTNEMDYFTANSVVRPPSSPTETPMSAVTGAPVVVNWTAPAFGVVATYTIYRSADGGTPVEIGSVSGINGNPPATTFTDTTPAVGATTVAYTISTTLLPIPVIDPTPRQSAPSPPAVLTNNQSIVLGALPGSVTLGNSQPTVVTATAQTNGAANGLQVSFSATGQCAIGAQSINTGSGVSSATLTLNSAGSCAITASQAGASGYNAANPVSGTFAILPQGSTTQSQSINIVSFPANVQYGSTFSVSASSSVGAQVHFSASGPCSVGATAGTATGATTGAGVCAITASAPATSTNNGSYSAASVTPSFAILPATLTVTAGNVSINYGQQIPALTSFSFGTFVNGDTASVVSGVPALSTTATATSNAGTYPITVTTGTLAAANYSFLYVTGTLTIQSVTPTVSWSAAPPASAAYNSQFTVLATSNSAGAITYSASGGCGNNLGVVTMTSGATACQVSASVAPTTNYTTGSVGPTSVTATLAAQTIAFTTPAPSSEVYKGTFPVAATSSSGLGVSLKVDAASTAVCSLSGGTVTMNSGAGTCTIDANQSGNGNYGAATQAQTSAAATMAAPTVSWSAAPPASAAYNSQFTVLATSNSTGAITYSASGGCGNNLGVVTMTSGATACQVSASVAPTTNYTTGSVGPTSVTATLAAQAITFTTNAPASAAYNGSFTVAATASSGLAVAYSSSGACSNAGATYTMTNSTGTCSVIANQAGSTNYSKAPTVTQTVNAIGPLVTVSPSSINFGTVTLGSITTKNITVSNIGTAPVTINEPLLSIVQGGNSNEFVAVNLCLTPLAAGKSCTITIAFVAGPYYTPQTATLEIMDNAPGSPQPVTLSATVLIPQAITFTTKAPASAVFNSSFTVAATGGASGNAVTFTSSGACTNSGATYTMISGTGTCAVIANQAGNTKYAAAAQVTQTVSATLAPQTITFTTNAPASAAYNSSFTVAATGGASGNAVTFASSGSCTNSGAKYTMTSGTGTCSVIASQACNSNYAAATVTKTVTATLVAQAITFTTNAPASAVYESSFTVAATGGASGNAVTFTSSGSCTNSGAKYTMTSGTGTCSVIANQAGNSNYAAATKVTQTVNASYSSASLGPASLNFGTVTSGKSSTAQTVTLTNTGTTPLIVNSIGFTGTNASSFVQTNTCPSSSSSLAAGKSCTISVTFNSSGKAASANLTVTDNTQAGTQTVSLSGS